VAKELTFIQMGKGMRVNLKWTQNQVGENTAMPMETLMRGNGKMIYIMGMGNRHTIMDRCMREIG
jgi:hypothetical protein